VIGPTFMGAEPDRIDEGPHKGLRLFLMEELESLKLMQGLPTELQQKATLSKGMGGQSLASDRWNPFDERHLGGARQDNRILPYGKWAPHYWICILKQIRGLSRFGISSRKTAGNYQSVLSFQRVLSRNCAATPPFTLQETSE
jgi:hypothetical protein